MIKAETIYSQQIGDDHIVGAVQFDAKGKHHELVVELGAIINTFNEKPDYRLELMDIIKHLLEHNLDEGIKELEKLKKGE